MKKNNIQDSLSSIASCFLVVVVLGALTVLASWILYNFTMWLY
jgi:cation transport ATPase